MTHHSNLVLSPRHAVLKMSKGPGVFTKDSVMIHYHPVSYKTYFKMSIICSLYKRQRRKTDLRTDQIHLITK